MAPLSNYPQLTRLRNSTREKMVEKEYSYYSTLQNGVEGKTALSVFNLPIYYRDKCITPK